MNDEKTKLDPEKEILFLLGKLTEQVSRIGNQGDRIESQQTIILDQQNDARSEMQRIGTAFVDLRAEVKSIESRLAAVEGGPGQMRPRMSSETHESMRVMATENQKQSTSLQRVEQLTEVQTSILTDLKKASVKTVDSERTKQILIGIGIVIYGFFSMWSSSRPVVLSTPMGNVPASPAPNR